MKFKIGDRVKIADTRGTNTKVGDVGTIVGYDNKGLFDYALDLDRYNPFLHSCGGITPANHGQWVSDVNLSLLNEENTNREFKLIIISNGDKTTGKLIHGKSVTKTCEVNRYYKDEYSEQDAIKAVVDKMFPCDSSNNEKYLTAKVVCTESHGFSFRKGNIYEIVDGYLNGDIGMYSGIKNEKDLDKNGGYKFIILNEN